MANKRLYWLKLKEDFFKSKEMKKLRKVAGGDTYVIIYLKMQLLSLKNEGKLYFDGIDDDFASELALELDEEVENVRITLSYLEHCKLLECISSEEYFLPAIPDATVSETRWAGYKRQARKLDNVQSVSNTSPKNVPLDIDIDIDIDKDIEDFVDVQQAEQSTTKQKEIKHKYGEYLHVLLTDKQYTSLIEKYGQTIIDGYIQKIDEWIQLKGKSPYKDFNLAIQNWLKKDNVQPMIANNQKQDNGGWW